MAKRPAPPVSRGLMPSSQGPSRVVSPAGCPDDLPVVYLHHGAGVDMVYADRPVLIVCVDDGVPQDRVFVRVAQLPPDGLIHGPISCTGHGSAEEVQRKHRLVAWLKTVAAGLASLTEREAVH